ncbi:FliH/SctL family protein [Novosphingobium sp. TH158]|uniref:FliH/SctL family protein n=1 Tax=Novosphingobium sp. TH158 TaxID=2067455 RepID=UPI000C7AE2D9|nr:FliH/SctL family protein [Novosphingobium sp. TH158]PLK27635.1 flagellar biosynthesis protein [Novosphingobium sp. TH158]
MSSLAALAGRGEAAGFRQDRRFAPPGPLAEPLPPIEPETEPEDPLALAFSDGFAAGIESARAEAAAQAQADADAREALGLSLSRLDAEMAEDLRQRMVDTVMALCEATLVPFALDPDALAARVERAVAMLARADDERVIRLHPDDLKLVAGKLDQQWTVQGDPSLARGHLRVESSSGGVEDGPAQWRVALAEAFESC